MEAKSMSEIRTSWKEFVGEIQQQILPRYQNHEQHFDAYGVHGRMHICRALMFAELMSRYYIQLSHDLDMRAIRTAIAMHDIGRQGNGVDRWEIDSAAQCHAYLQPKTNEGYSAFVANLITKSAGDWDIHKKIVHDADVLEIMRPCCGHGGINGFRQQVLRFAGIRDKFAANFENPAALRQKLITEAWNWICATEEIKHQFSNSNHYLADLLEYLHQNADRYPLLSTLVRNPCDLEN